MIIVTGATGLLGSHLLAHLALQNKSVKALVRSVEKQAEVKKIFTYYGLDLLKSKIEFVEADFTNIQDLLQHINEGDTVYHCAAQVSFNPKKSNEIISSNVNLAAVMVNACTHQKVEALCHVSSIAALGKNIAGTPADETCFWKAEEQNSAYGCSKYLSENEVWRGIEEGLNAVIVNPSIILGEGFWKGGSGTFWTSAYKNKNYFYPPGSIGFIDVKDVAKAMIALTEAKLYGERFVLNSQNLSYLDFFSILNQSLELAPPKFAIGRTGLTIAATINGWVRTLLNKEINFSKETVEAALEKNFFNGEKIQKNISFSYTPINEAINRISEIFLKEKNSFFRTPNPFGEKHDL